MDKIFKIGLLVLGFLYLAHLFCPISNQAGRYNLRVSGNEISLFDTATADWYIHDNKQKKWIRANIKKGNSEILEQKEGTKQK
jgi:hypothetical protein